MQKRRVTAPDGTKWIVGRRWLLHRPRYLGFRFGVDKAQPDFEPPAGRLEVERRPAPTKLPWQLGPAGAAEATAGRTDNARRRLTIIGLRG